MIGKEADGREPIGGNSCRERMRIGGRRHRGTARRQWGAVACDAPGSEEELRAARLFGQELAPEDKMADAAEYEKVKLAFVSVGTRRRP